MTDIVFMDPNDVREYEALKAAGHSPALEDDGDGEMYFDMFYLSDDPHNGPGCSICKFSFCQHCWDGGPLPKCNVIVISCEEIKE